MGKLLILHGHSDPYVEGRNGTDAKPLETQWAQCGAAIKKLHSAHIPNALTSGTPRETFSSKWRETVKAFLMRIENEVFKEPVAVKMATFLKSKKGEILKLVQRAEALAIRIQKQPLGLCVMSCRYAWLEPDG